MSDLFISKFKLVSQTGGRGNDDYKQRIPYPPGRIIPRFAIPILAIMVLSIAQLAGAIKVRRAQMMLTSAAAVTPLSDISTG